MRIKNVIKGSVPYHLLVWTLLVGPHAFFSSYLISQNLALFFLAILVQDGLIIGLTYVNILWIIPRFYGARQYLIFTLLLVVQFCFYLAAAVEVDAYIGLKLGVEEKVFFSLAFNFFNICRYTVTAFLLFGLRKQLEQKKILELMQVEKLQAEVKYLRAQINPHFLFNTLNNLYGLALQKSERTPEVVVRLSKMMDYMLFELEDARILLQRDLDHLADYIDLEKIRQGNNATIRFNVSGDVGAYQIEPLLLLPLVENAFKHGVNQMMEGSYLDINVSVSEGKLEFKIKNNYKRKVNDQGQVHNSLGLSNLRKRLNLSYPGRHQLQIFDDDSNYEVTLLLEL